MKKCIARTSDRILPIPGAFVCAAVAFFSLRDYLYGAETAALLVGIFASCITVYVPFRMYAISGRGFYYDEEKIIFALSRKDRLEFRWKDLQSAMEASSLDITRQHFPEIWNFYFLKNGKIQQLSAMPRMAGYEELLAMLKKKEVPFHEADRHVVYDKKWADEIFRQVGGSKKEDSNEKH